MVVIEWCGFERYGGYVKRYSFFRTVTVPRSGNNLFLRYLYAYYFLPLLSVDQSVTIDKAWFNNIPGFTSRSHDLKLTVNIAELDTLTIVQFREPAAQFMSFVERSERSSPGIISDLAADALWRWAADQAAYTTEFLNKWAREPTPDTIILDYSTLVLEPHRSTEHLLNALGIEVDADRLEKAIAHTAPTKGMFASSDPFVKRDLSISKFVPMELVDAYADYVRCAAEWAGFSHVGNVVPEATKSSFASMVGKYRDKRRRIQRSN